MTLKIVLEAGRKARLWQYSRDVKLFTLSAVVILA